MLKGNVALVTGSTSGIGLGIATALAAEGCSVMLSGLGDATKIETARAGMARRFGVKVMYNNADLGKPDACIDLVTDAKTRLGSVDVLVNNAGIQYLAPVEIFPAERWDEIIAINLSSFFHTIRSALPGMTASGWGRIINIASVHGLVASINKAGYVAAKHGVIGLTKVVALEAAATGVTCNAICPGWVLTPLVQTQIEERAREKGISRSRAERELLLEKQPSTRFTTVEQIGQLVVFLCSEAAENITGTSLPADGGWTAQ